jgi:hypothetical protein
MREVTFERPARADASRVLQRIEKWLITNGYEVAVRSNFELSLVGMGPGGRHRLAVRADGQTVRFSFAPGSPGVTLPDSTELERRVDLSVLELSSVTSPASAPVAPERPGRTRRCSICATVMNDTQSVCPTCGMAQ